MYLLIESHELIPLKRLIYIFLCTLAVEILYNACLLQKNRCAPIKNRIRIDVGSMAALKCIEIIESKLKFYDLSSDLSLNDDIVKTDGADVMKKVGEPISGH